MLYKKHGFTLVELMVALALTGLVLTAVYKTFAMQQKVYTTQEQVVEAQQDLRAGLEVMERELRMAGFNPAGTAGGWGVTAATDDSVTFTWDQNEDGALGAGETVTYTLTAVPSGASVLDRQLDGAAYDPGTGANSGNIVADNIDALNFVYLNASGAVIATPVVSGSLRSIRSVEITMVVRSGKSDVDFVNTTQYTNLRGTVILASGSDHHRRRILRTTVRCRNLGLT